MRFQYGHLLPKLIHPLYSAIPLENGVDFFRWKEEKCSFGTVFCYQKSKSVSLVRYKQRYNSECSTILDIIGRVGSNFIVKFESS